MTDQNVGHNGFLQASYSVTGKICGIFVEKSAEMAFMIAIDDGKNDYYSKYMHIVKDPKMFRLAESAMRMGEEVVIYCRVQGSAIEPNLVIGMGLYYSNAIKWWNPPYTDETT